MCFVKIFRQKNLRPNIVRTCHFLYLKIRANSPTILSSRFATKCADCTKNCEHNETTTGGTVCKYGQNHLWIFLATDTGSPFVLEVLYKRSKMGNILSKKLFLCQKIKQNSLIIYIPISAYPSRLQKIRFPEKLSNIGFL